MPRVKRLTEAEYVLLVNLGAAVSTTPAVVEEALRAARTVAGPRRVLSVSVNEVTAAYDRDSAGVVTPSNDPTLRAMERSLLPVVLRWRKGQRTRVRYAPPGVLGLPAYPPVVRDALNGWSLSVDGADLILTGPVPVVLVSMTGTQVRFRASATHPVVDLLGEPGDARPPRAEHAVVGAGAPLGAVPRRSVLGGLGDDAADGDDAAWSPDMRALMGDVRSRIAARTEQV